jgi:hypothetical protein
VPQLYSPRRVMTRELSAKNFTPLNKFIRAYYL